MAGLPLTLAIGDYDHVRDLTSGKIRPEGIDLTALEFPVEEIFFRFSAFAEWHASEFSMAKYTSLVASGDTRLTAIPVFPSRVFRHSAIFVRADGDVREPSDLSGRRVGVPEWAHTAAVYARGVLAHEYGLDLAAVKWVQAGVNQAGRREKVALDLPDGIELTAVGDRSLDEMLSAGDLDAVIAAHPPHSFFSGSGDVVRLFPDFLEREADYGRRTGIFPIMHLIALRRDAFDANPWVAMNLLTAFEEARRRSLERLSEPTVSRVMIPWGFSRVHEASELFGTADPWAYGIEPNRATLEAFLGFAHEQGVASRALTVEELFPAEVQRAYRI
jgi:4,5-dihydroxyphthalate decarboxylase